MTLFLNFLLLLLSLCALPKLLCQDAAIRNLFEVSESDDSEEAYARKDAQRGQFGFYVSFRTDKTDVPFCSGTLISPKWILTSASCLDPEFADVPISGFKAHIGVFDLDPHIPEEKNISKSESEDSNDDHCPPDFNMEVKRVKIPKKYSNGSEGRPPYDARYDIALVELKKPSLQQWALLPVELPNCCENEYFLNVGLGHSDHSRIPENVEMAAFPYIPFTKCEDAFKDSNDETLGKGTKNISAEMTICVSGQGEFCHLGVGGALLQYRGSDSPPVVIGLANRATKPCSYGEPYAFSNISFHMDWIQGVKGVIEDMTGFEREPNGCSPVLSIEEQVIGGKDAKRGRFPYAVSIRDGGHLCQGVLISPRHVLTVGSCVPPEDFTHTPSKIKAYIGGIHREPDSDEGDHEVIPADKILHHKRFSCTDCRHPVDMAIIRLKRNSKKAPIKLPIQNKRCCRKGMKLRTYGWGAESDANNLAEKLQTGVMAFKKRKICKEEGLDDQLHRKAFCAGEAASGSALCGDLGSPLILAIGKGQDVLIGIGYNKTIDDCGRRPVPFYKISKFLKWVETFT